MRKNSFPIIGVLAAGGEARARHHPDGDRNARLATGHEPQFGGVVGDHIHRHRGKIHQHDFGDRPVAAHRRADGRTNDRLF